MKAVGGTLSEDDLRNYLPAWRETESLPIGVNKIHTLPGPSRKSGHSIGGPTALSMWSMLVADDRYENTGGGERAYLVAEASLRASLLRTRYANSGPSSAISSVFDSSAIAGTMEKFHAGRHVPTAEIVANAAEHRENPSGIGFAVVDGEGSSVACNVTLNNLFGIGRMAPGTGIALGAVPEKGAVHSFSPVIIANRNVGDTLFVGGSSGGASAPAAMVQTMMRVLTDGLPLEEAISALRLYHGGIPDMVVHEPTEDPEMLNALARQGHKLLKAGQIGRVNAIYCPKGARRQSGTCAFVSDPRGYGLATASQF